MGSGGCTNQVNSCEDLGTNSFKKLDSISVVETHEEVAEVAEISEAHKTNSLGPITPDSDRENGDFPITLNSPPSSVKKRESGDCFDSETERMVENPSCFDDHASPRTPKDGVFDPFAPGPDDLALAPQCRKYVSKSRSVVARRLSFDFSVKVLDDKDCRNDALSISDEEIVEAMYESLLDTIVSCQTEIVLAEISSLEWDSNNCRTPPSAPHLSGVAETCPGAPLRPAGKSRKIDLALCRRLQFSP